MKTLQQFFRGCFRSSALLLLFCFASAADQFAVAAAPNPIKAGATASQSRGNATSARRVPMILSVFSNWVMEWAPIAFKAACIKTCNQVVVAQQTITFDALPPRRYGDAPFLLTATATSGLQISYDSTDPSIVTVQGNEVTIHGAGATAITATQAGDASYLAATPVVQELTITQASQIISFGVLPDKRTGALPVALTATATSGLAITYESSDPSVATISGSTLSIFAAGTTTITANQAGNTNYLPATPVMQTLSVTPLAPTSSTSFSPPGGTYVDSIDVVISSTPGTSIHYTVDGSEPNLSSPSYTEPVKVTQSQSLKAIAVDSLEVYGSVTAMEYVIQVAKPTLSPSYKTFGSSVSVTSSTATTGSTLHYTTDGSLPTLASPPLPVPLVLTETTTLQVIATREGCTSSALATGTYTHVAPATPILSPPPGAYFGPLTVTMTANPADLAVWYTQTPIAQAAVTPQPGVAPAVLYTAPVIITASSTLRAVCAPVGGTAPADDWAGGAYTILDSAGYGLGGGSSIESYTSPAPVEGTGTTKGVHLLATSTCDSTAIGTASVVVLGANRFYAEAPLQPAPAVGQEKTTVVTVSAGDPGGHQFTLTKNVVWKIIGLNQPDQDDLIIRQGDSIQFAATGSGGTSIDINPGNLAGGFGTVRSTSNVPVRITYPEAGYYLASAWENGHLLGSRRIIVVGVTTGVSAGIAAQVGVAREVTIGLTPKGATALVHAESADPTLMSVTVSEQNYEDQLFKVSITVNDRRLPVLVLRTSAGGPILATKVINEFTLELAKTQVTEPGYSGSAETGSSAICLMRPALPGLTADGTITSDDDEISGEAIAVITVTADYAAPGSYRIPVVKQDGVTISRSGNFAPDAITTASLTLAYDDGEDHRLRATAVADLDGDEIPDWVFPPIAVSLTVEPKNEFIARRLQYSRPREVGYQNEFIPQRTYANYRALRALWADVYATWALMPLVTEFVFASLESADSGYEWQTVSYPCQPVMFYFPAQMRYSLSMRLGGTDVSMNSYLDTSRDDNLRLECVTDYYPIWTETDANGHQVGLHYEITVAGRTYWQQYDPTPPARMTTSADNNASSLNISVAAGADGFASVPISVSRGGIPLPLGNDSDPIIPQRSAIVDLLPGVYTIGPFTLTVTGSAGATMDLDHIAGSAASLTAGPADNRNFASTSAVDTWTGSLYRLEQVPQSAIPHYWWLVGYDTFGYAGSMEIDIGSLDYRVTPDVALTFQRSDNRTNWKIGGYEGAEWIFAGDSLTATRTVDSWYAPSVSPFFNGRDDESTLTVGNGGGTRFLVTAVGARVGKGRPSVRTPAEPVPSGFGSIELEEGNLRLEFPVHQDPFAGSPLSVTLHYNSQDYWDCGYGPGWMTNFDARLVVQGGDRHWTNMLFVDEDGKRLWIARSAGVNRPNNEVRWELAFPDDLVRTLDLRQGTSLPADEGRGWAEGDRFRLTAHDGSRKYFDSKGLLVRVTTPSTTTVTIKRDANGRITALTDSHSRRFPLQSSQGFAAAIGSGTLASPITAFSLSGDVGIDATYATVNHYQELSAIAVSGKTADTAFSFLQGAATLRHQFTYASSEDTMRRANEVKVSCDGADEQMVHLTRTFPAGMRSKVTIAKSWGGDDVWSLGVSRVFDGVTWTCNDLTPPVGPERHQAFLFQSGRWGLMGWSPLKSLVTYTGAETDQIARSKMDFDSDGRLLRMTKKLTATQTLDQAFLWKTLKLDGQTNDPITISYIGEQTTCGITGIEDANVTDLSTKRELFSDLARFGRTKSIVTSNGLAQTFEVASDDPYPNVIRDESLEAWTVTARNATGQPETYTTPENRTLQFAYDDVTHATIRQTSEFGYQTSFQRDGSGFAVDTTLPGGTHVVTHRDPLNRITRSSDQLGRTVVCTYDTLGRLRKQTQSPGTPDANIPAGPTMELVITYEKIGTGNSTEWRETQFRNDSKVGERIYDAIGRLVSEATPRTLVDGAASVTECTTTYTYDSQSGYLQHVADPDSHQTDYESDRFGAITAITSPMGVRRSVERNALGWVTSESVGSGASALVSRRTYDRSGRLVRAINPAGGWQVTGYDAAGRAISERASLGKGSSASYDKDGMVETATDAAGNTVTITTSQSGEGSSHSAIRSLTRAGVPGLERSERFDARGFASLQQTQIGGVTSFTATEHRDDDSVLSITGPATTTLTVGIDGAGRVVRTRQAAAPGGAILEVSRAVASNGDVTGETNAQGYTVEAIPDPATGEVNLVRSNAATAAPGILSANQRILVRDRRGNVLESGIFTAAASGTDDPPLKTVQTFDYDNRLTSRTAPDGVRIAWEYDDVGRTTFVRRGPAVAAAVVAHYTYDQLGDVTSVTDGSGKVRTSTYDTLGTLTSETVGNDTTSYVYHPDTRALAKVIHPDGGVTEHVPDARGRLGTVINPRGFRTVYDYDDLDRVIHIHRPKPGETDPAVANAQPVTEDITYVADTTQVKTRTDLAGRVITHIYDGIGRLTRREIDDHGTVTRVFVDHDDQVAGGGSKQTTYVGAAGAPNADGAIVRTYDRAGRLANLKLPEQSVISLAYDTAGRLTNRDGVAYAYKPTGQLDTVSGNGGLAKFYFDTAGRLDSIDLPHGLKRAFSYDPADRPETLTNYLGSTAAESWSQSYDDQGRISHLDSSANGILASSTAYAYRGGRLIGEDRIGAAAVNAVYGYDANGNRTRVIRYDTPADRFDDFSDPQTSTLPELASGWTVANGTLNVDLPASGSNIAVTATTELALTASGEVHGPRISVSVNPALVAASGSPQGTVAAGLQLTVDATTAYRAQWRRQLSADFEPVTSGRLVLEQVTTAGTTSTTALIVESEPIIEASILPVSVSVITGADGVLTVSASNAVIGTLGLEAEVDLGPAYAEPPAVALVTSATGTCRANATYDQPSWTTSPTRTVGRDVYDGLDRQLSHQDLDGAGEVVAGTTYGHDALGRMSNRVSSGGSVLVTYGYDALDRMQSQTAGGVTTTFSYMGPEWMRRLATTSTGASTSWTYDDQGITSRSNGGQATAYQRLGDGLLWEAAGGTTRSYALDSHGNVSGLVGALTAVDGMTTADAFVSRFDYDAWGQIVRERFGQLNGRQPEYPALLTAFSSGPRYRGMWYDGGSAGMYKTATRFYDPGLGQFLQEDPARAGGNWYAYCDGDPVNRMDPSGLAGYFFDGTGNHPNDTNPFDGSKNYKTNVRNLFEAYIGEAFYAYGIGTGYDPEGHVYDRMENSLGWGSTYTRTDSEGATGATMHERVNWMMGKLEKQLDKNDKVVEVFGFSRGSASALEFLTRIEDKVKSGDSKYQGIEIRFVGLFDAVSSMRTSIAAGVAGDSNKIVPYPIPGMESLSELNGLSEYRFSLPRGLKYTNIPIHLVAMDEQRQQFQSIDVQGALQVGFRGVHSDIGGGYGPENDFDWQTSAFMVQRAKMAGLKFREGTLRKKSDSLDRFNKWWSTRQGFWSSGLDVTDNSGWKYNDNEQRVMPKGLIRHQAGGWYNSPVRNNWNTPDFGFPGGATPPRSMLPPNLLGNP